MRHLNISLYCIALSISLPCFAEKADRDKPMHIEADQVVMDDGKKISTFSGGVQLNQGTMVMRGGKIVVTEDKDAFKHATITGTPASFRQKREGFDEYVDGDALRIEYDTHADTIDLYGQAHIKRELDDIRGEHITYSTQTEIFQVESGPVPSSPNAKQKRVKAVLQPKRDKDKDKPPTALPIRTTPALSPTE